MSATTQKLAILFADISGSTALYEKLGDQPARRLISRCLAILNDALITYKGTLVKTIGDEILCTFPSAEAAMKAACDMQMAVKIANQNNPQPIYIRIGFHYGDVISEDGDIFGDAVNVAARVAAITRANQIMTTAAVVIMLPPALHDKARKILRTDIKGKQEQLDIFQVMWELEEDMSSTRIGLSAFHKSNTENKVLLLTYKNRSFEIDAQNKKLMLGRDDSCHIIVDSDFASRQHADVEFRFGNFILTDHSSNGTYIRNNDGNETGLNREDSVLRGRGTISLGQPYADHPVELLEYEIKNTG